MTNSHKILSIDKSKSLKPKNHSKIRDRNKKMLCKFKFYKT